MTIREHITFRIYKLLMWVSKMLGIIPRILMIPSRIVQFMAICCIPKSVKEQIRNRNRSQMVSQRMGKKRNLKCPCGSGRKYKNCCWKKNSKRAR